MFRKSILCIIPYLPDFKKLFPSNKMYILILIKWSGRPVDTGVNFNASNPGSRDSGWNPFGTTWVGDFHDTESKWGITQSQCRNSALSGNLLY